MTSEAKKFLNKFKPDLQPIKVQVEKYFDSDSGIRNDGALQAFKRPWVAPLNFGVLIFPPATKGLIEKYNERSDKPIPPFCIDILRQMNGCFIYDFSLFGLPQSIYTNNLLDRSFLQQYDLGTANTSWIKEYEINNNAFHFGGRAYSDEENIGYFFHNNNIFSLRQNGEVVSEWRNLNDFLKDEVDLAEQMMLDEKPSQSNCI